MPITIGSNIASLNAQRRLGDGTKELLSVFERLSSGQRINRAGDDAAGVAISDSLRADRRVYDQGVRNLNDGISLLAIADSTVESLTNIVIRLQELAEQSANGIYGAKQREGMDKEAQALSREYLRVSQSASFNGKNIFTSDFGSLKLQAGFGANGGILSNLGGATGTGALDAKTEYALTLGAQTNECVALGDLNGDGFLDLVSGIDEGSDGVVSVQLGTATGTFGSAATYRKSGSVFNALVLADLNNDGILDVVTNELSSLNIRLGNGDGTFRANYTTAPQGSTITGIAVGDMNGDGKIDIATNASTAVGVTVRLGAGNGLFDTSTNYTMEATASRDVSLGDINNDGVLDLISAGTGGGVGVFTTRLGNGDGSFRASTGYTIDTSTTVLDVGDLNVYGPAAEVKPLPGFFRWSMRGVTTANVYPASY